MKLIILNAVTSGIYNPCPKRGLTNVDQDLCKLFYYANTCFSVPHKKINTTNQWSDIGFTHNEK